MRRLWAVGAAFLMCLVLGGLPVAAQSDTATVTAIQDCDLEAVPVTCTYAASDPRVSGTLTFEWAGDAGGPFPSEAQFAWTDTTLEGPEGDWVGHYYIVWGQEAVAFSVLSGVEAYEGWQYIASGIDPEADGDHDWVGVIYEGTLPPFPSPAAPTDAGGDIAVVMDEVPDTTAIVTGTVLSVTADRSGAEFSEDDVPDTPGWVGHRRGVRSQVEFEWSDPRLPSQVEMVWNGEAYEDAGVAINSMWLLEGPEGHWSGPWSGWSDPEGHWHGTVVLTGHGVYEGLYATLTERPHEDAAGMVTQVFEGAILFGEMPPMPEPLVPSTH